MNKKITEDYVSFEVAKLLKEKGFNPIYCGMYYSSTGKRTTELLTSLIACPTSQMAMKWLREVHHYYIQVILDSWACDGHSGYYVILQRTDYDFEMMLQDAIYQTYEEAASAAIKYCLTNLI